MRAVLGSERDGMGRGRENNRIPCAPTRCARAGTAPLPPGGGVRGHRPPLPPGGPGVRGGDPRAPGRGTVAVTAGLAGAGAAGLGPQVRAEGRAGWRRPRGKFLGRERRNCVQLFLVSGRPRAAGAPCPAAPGAGRRPGGRGREDGARGHVPSGWGWGCGAGRLARARSPGCPRHPPAQTGCPQRRRRPGSPGAAGGRAEAGPGGRGGPGRGRRGGPCARRLPAALQVGAVVGAARVPAEPGEFPRVWRKPHLQLLVGWRSDRSAERSQGREHPGASQTETASHPRPSRHPRATLSPASPGPRSHAGGRGRLRRRVRRSPEMGRGECLPPCPVGTGSRASRGEGAAGSPFPGPSRAPGSRLVCACLRGALEALLLRCLHSALRRDGLAEVPRAPQPGQVPALTRPGSGAAHP